jgi:menaquinone-specific isochorismate synthase
MEPRHGRDGRIGPAATEVAVAARPVPAAPTRALLDVVDRPRIGWSRGDVTVAAGGSAHTLVAGGPDRFASIRADAETLFDGLEAVGDVPDAARPRLFGGFAVHEAHDPPADGPWQGYPGAMFVLPAIQLTDTEDGTWLTAAASGPQAGELVRDRLDRWADRLDALPDHAPGTPPGIRRRRPRPDRDGWHEQVEVALDGIDRGDLRKVVLAQSLAVDLARPLAVSDALTRLAETYPDCTRFLVDPGTGGTFFGATPERLVRLEGREVQTTVLAGSTGRGDTDAEDDWLATELQHSAKDDHEHAVVREAVRDQLAPLTTEVTAAERRVRRLATVQHLETPITATLAADRHVLELVEALHPTPAVGGMPQDAALRTIREHEGFDRGWYAAPVGWIDAAGDGAFSVALRSAVAREDTATLFAGAGIVADSDPDREWSELQLKYRPILDVLE